MRLADYLVFLVVALLRDSRFQCRLATSWISKYVRSKHAPGVRFETESSNKTAFLLWKSVGGHCSAWRFR